MRTMIRASCLSAVVLGLLALAGCNWEAGLNLKYQWSMSPGDLKWMEQSPSNHLRKLTVTMKPSPAGTSVSCAVVYQEDLEEAKKAIKLLNEPPKYLESH